MSAVENTIVDDFERKMQAQERAIGIVEKIWDTFLAGIERPAKLQFALWVAYNGLPDLPLISYAIEEAARKNVKLGGTMTQCHAVRFISAVVSAHRRKRREDGLRKNRPAHYAQHDEVQHQEKEARN
jgi:hypothetical protein